MKDDNQMELAITCEPIVRLIDDKPDYPTLLAITSLFAPVRDRTVLQTKDYDDPNENRIETPWGSIQRLGAGLNMFDEDTLIALLQRARQYRHEGPLSQLPVPLDHEGVGIAYTGVVTVYQINKYLGRDTSGSALEETRKSIFRLSRTILNFSGAHVEEDAKFFHIKAEKKLHGHILVQFPPLIVKLLERYIYIDMDLRRELSDTGKAVYRYFLAENKPGQECVYVLSDLAEKIGFQGRLSDFKGFLMGRARRASILKTMQDANFISFYEHEGRGANQKIIVGFC